MNALSGTLYTETPRLMESFKKKPIFFLRYEDFTKEQFYQEFGEGSTFPQIIMNDQRLGGCSDTIKYLKENNKKNNTSKL